MVDYEYEERIRFLAAMLPLLDSHIHLYKSSDIPNLAWAQNISEPHCLLTQNSQHEYLQAIGSSTDVRGFIFVETDRKSGLRHDEWDHVLEEVRYMASTTTIMKQAQFSAGHTEPSALAIVPWAPIPAGPEVVASYMKQVEACCGDPEISRIVKGVRYLFQDKPSRLMQDPSVIAGLKWLAEHDLTFDLGVDARTGGLQQLDLACEMLHKVNEGGLELTTIINHMCKPNLRLTQAEIRDRHSDFAGWKVCIQNFAKLSRTFMKLSGAFSELPPQDPHKPVDIETLVDQLRPWFAVLLEYFGPSRIMFGSDWPVCNVGGPGPELSWRHWHKTVIRMLEDANVSEESKAEIWYGTAARAYKIS